MHCTVALGHWYLVQMDPSPLPPPLYPGCFNGALVIRVSSVPGNETTLGKWGVIRQLLSQLTERWQPHAWWGFVVLFVNCNVFVALYHRTAFYGFGSITTICSLSPGRRRLPWSWSRPSRGSWCHLPNALSNFGDDQSSPPNSETGFAKSIQFELSANGAKRDVNKIQKYAVCRLWPIL